MEIFELPFNFLRIPNFKLRIPHISPPSAMTVFAVVFLSYFLVLSGIIYDIIVEPPSIGVENQKPVAFLLYRINGQFIIEGLAAGLLFSVGGLGFIILDRSNKKHTTERNRYLLILSGVICILVAYNLCIVFIRMKIPGYLH